MNIDIAQAIQDFGFPIVAATGMGFFVYYIWKWVTETIEPMINETMGTLIKLVDRVRMLDNDMIRLNTKVAMVLEHKSLIDKNLSKDQVDELDQIVSKYRTQSTEFNSTGKK